MSGNAGSSSSNPTASSALSRIREVLSRAPQGSSSGSSSSPLAIESDKSFITRKIGAIGNTLDTTQAVKGSMATVYKYIPAWLLSWKTFLVAIILFGIVWVVGPYIKMFSSLADTAKSFMNIMSSSDDDDKATEATLMPEAQAPEAQAPETQAPEAQAPETPGPAEDKIKAKLNGKAVLSDAPKPDDAASSVQGGAQGGFCLAGEWNGQRTCLQVDRKTDCVSGQLFKTQATCENPSLRY